VRDGKETQENGGSRTRDAHPRLEPLGRDGAKLRGILLDVSLTENKVTIEGSKSSEQKEEQGDYYRCEIARDEFLRTATLPSVVDAEKAEA
jgi:hypothetical protein